MISCHHDNLLTGHFEIKKARELVAKKYLRPTLYQDVKPYIRGCDVCLALKAVCYKSCEDLHSSLVRIYY